MNGEEITALTMVRLEVDIQCSGETITSGSVGLVCHLNGDDTYCVMFRAENDDSLCCRAAGSELTAMGDGESMPPPCDLPCNAGC
jgi:hypothetical protein